MIYRTILFFSLVFLMACGSTQKTVVANETEKQTDESAEVDYFEISDKEQQAFEATEGDPVEISDEESEYEIIIIDPGFYTWLNSIARPEGYYSQTFLENRNQIFVVTWNQRVLQPARFSSNLYELQIDYSPHIDYGYEVNYKLYNYFIYFQRKYNQRLGPFIPRI